MAEATPLDFPELRAARIELNDFSLRHEPSVLHFRHTAAAWFYLTDDERQEEAGVEQVDVTWVNLGRESALPIARAPGVEDPPPQPARVRHLTTTASCIESLYDLRERSDDQIAALRGFVDTFADTALARGIDAWQSEEAAHVYCKVRALPAILEYASDAILASHVDKIEELVTYAWANVADKPRHQGIFEYKARDDEDHRKKNEYPPNAFLTFWGLRVLEALGQRGLLVDRFGGMTEKYQTALLWAERTLGAQVALHASRSDIADPQQLAWAISTVVRFGDSREVATAQTVDFLRAGLHALFAQQRPAGNFPRGEPLFHYPAAGNAYCYTLETFAELLHLSLEEERGAVLRDLLRPYSSNLLTLWQWARDSASEIGTKENPAVGWCSAHHPHRTSPESWATAAGFHALQALRALIGVWGAQIAGLRLGVRKPKVSAREEAANELSERANTWDSRPTSEKIQENVGAMLGSLFVNPIIAREAAAASTARRPLKLDPDVALIAADQARSAILFGPPGTGKTTIVELLAGAIGWDFVEILPSAFLAEGLDNVPKQADMIFQAVMELDRCVVLFDEADELIRDRSKEADPFGRFLTTSMLPKLAKLWDQRRVLFFLNTNWIDRADPAIKRSQRFDSAVFVLPPAFETKKAMLRDVLDDDAFGDLTRDKVEESLQENVGTLGWLALVRFDLMSELRTALRRPGRGASLQELEAELSRLGEQLSKSDWMTSVPEKTAFVLYRELAGSQRRDFGRLRYVGIGADVETLPPQYLEAYRYEKATFLAIPPGVIVPPESLSAEGWEARRNAVLWYSLGDRMNQEEHRRVDAEVGQIGPPPNPSPSQPR